MRNETKVRFFFPDTEDPMGTLTEELMCWKGELIQIKIQLANYNRYPGGYFFIPYK